jgi:hypothetical protein
MSRVISRVRFPTGSVTRNRLTWPPGCRFADERLAVCQLDGEPLAQHEGTWRCASAKECTAAGHRQAHSEQQSRQRDAAPSGQGEPHASRSHDVRPEDRRCQVPGGKKREARAAQGRAKIKVALVPPKPKEFDMASPIGSLRAAFGT